MKLLLTVYGLVCLTISLRAQHCQVTDESGNPIPYVNIYHPDMTRGVIADAEGYFSLPGYSSSNPVLLRFSCLGYQDKLVRTDTLLTSAACTVILQERTYELPAVELTAAPQSWRSKWLGTKQRWPLYQLGFGADKAKSGFELGYPMANESECILETIQLDIAQVLGDQEPRFELNIYQLQADGTPGRTLHRERIFFQPSAGRYRIDLSGRAIPVTGAFIIAVEVVEAQAGLLIKSKRDASFSYLTKDQTGSWAEVTDNLRPGIAARLRCAEAQ
ncbi:MAG: hypothetical protein GVY26_19595 [Bacteroidetes bacterium]|jgi:hypothetical protein|nr:hypothetical protein [Bacteroidota bacterium]